MNNNSQTGVNIVQETQLFEENQDLANSLAHRYCWDSYYLEDLQQEAKLALWEAALLYAEEGEEHDHLFQTVAYYKISGACRDYRNIFFNVVTVPKNEAVSKRAYSNLLSLLEFTPEIFNMGIDPSELASVWEHEKEKELSYELRKKIRALKSRVCPSKANYRKVVKRNINFGTPAKLEINCSSYASPTETMLDIEKFKDGLSSLHRAILDLRVSGNSVGEIALILKKSPRYVRDTWFSIKRQILEIV